MRYIYLVPSTGEIIDMADVRISISSMHIVVAFDVCYVMNSMEASMPSASSVATVTGSSASVEGTLIMIIGVVSIGK